VAALRELDHDIVQKEQYLDFFKCRRFRQTLLCRAEIQLDRALSSGMARKFLIASRAKPKSPQPNLTTGVPEEFSNPIATVRVGDPLAKAALVDLYAHWPRACSFAELAAAVRRRLDIERIEESQLCDIVLAGFAGGLLELQLHQPNWNVGSGIRPELGRLARFQLENNRDFVTGLRGSNSRVDATLRTIYLLMDGSRDHAGIADELRRQSDMGHLRLPLGATPTQIRTEVDRLVREAARAGLLIAWDDTLA
jgi:methyltransferase-like protein